MRILVDLTSHLSTPVAAPEIVQVQRQPAIGSAGETINGKYAIPVPLDMEFPVDASSYILDGAGQIDGGGVVGEGYAHLLALYPAFENIYFNPLLTSDHVAELVLDQTFSFVDRSADPPNEFYARFQTGREVGAADEGQMPSHTALMPLNSGVTPRRPGLIITDAIDIGPYTLDCDGNPVGADEFAVFWKLYTYTESHDIAADFGSSAGVNLPAARLLHETDQEPADFTVYLSTDEGDNWCPVDMVDPVGFCDKTTTVRLAFVNESSTKLFLASFALMF